MAILRRCLEALGHNKQTNKQKQNSVPSLVRDATRGAWEHPVPHPNVEFQEHLTYPEGVMVPALENEVTDP